MNDKSYPFSALLVIAVGLFAIVSVGEWCGGAYGVGFSPSKLADRQNERPGSVAMPFDLQFFGPFKVRRAAQLNPEIVVIGTSRGGSFLASDFAPRRFYNLSFTAWTVQQIIDEFDELTKVAHPKVAIVTLDYFMFSPGWEKGYALSRQMRFFDPMHYFAGTLVQFAKAKWGSDRVNLDDMLRSRFDDITSYQHKEGFRPDGSFEYSEGHIKYAQKNEANAHFALNAAPGAQSMAAGPRRDLERLAGLARARGVKLVAIQLPLIAGVIDFVEHDPKYAPRFGGLWRQFESDATREWLADQGIQFLDWARSDVGQDTANYIDGLHLSESGMRKVLDQNRDQFNAAIVPPDA